jgi:hypothetical protein
MLSEGEYDIPSVGEYDTGSPTGTTKVSIFIKVFQIL